jgi:ankyrin repeat protein
MAQSHSGWTPLHSACSRGCEEVIVSLLLENGADPTITCTDNDGKTPLHFASRNGQEAPIRLLLEHGTNVNVKDNGGYTPLHYASKEGREAVVSLLLEKEADMNAQNEDGSTPLHIACYYGHEAIVSLLVEKGVNSSIINDGTTGLRCKKLKTKTDKIVLLRLRNFNNNDNNFKTNVWKSFKR